MKTRQEVEKLKHNWEFDPIWDVEKTEGFEEYHDELLTFSNEKKAKWNEENNSRRLKRSQELGIEGNYKLLNYIESLENRIEKIENYIGSER